MNIPLFEWMIVATYMNFIEPEDLNQDMELGSQPISKMAQ